MKRILVTGGIGFLGSALVRRLLAAGHTVRVLDNASRGSMHSLEDVRDEFEMVEADIRDAGAVARAVAGVDAVCHLASVNGTEYFYTMPEVVLEVGVKGIVNLVDACRQHGVGELIVASSSEVYQTPPVIPTDESAPLSIPDPLNPRYSYAGNKLISELYALNFGRKELERVVVFRPHNVYGPAMGRKHVIPQFILRMEQLRDAPEDPVPFPIQGSGQETRAFVYIDDFSDGLLRVIEHGEHLNIYHIGTTEEVEIADVARMVARRFGRSIDVQPGELAAGGTLRRCPDITKLTALGYAPSVSLEDGIDKTAAWYERHADPVRQSSDASSPQDLRPTT